MTGFGAATCDDGTMTVSVEIKTVNNRYLKLMTRLPDAYAALEPHIESVVRETISRGSVSLTIKIRREKNESNYQINTEILQDYADQLSDLVDKPKWEKLLSLPGVVEELANTSHEKVEQATPLVETSLKAAIESLQRMRHTEGESMKRDLLANVDEITKHLTEIERLAPNVVKQYRERLSERISAVLSEKNLTLNENDIIREVALFADRCDISEEMVRLRSHLKQFNEIANQENSSGRKLDFLTQEMFRETNTMGTKANDANITKYAVEIKSVVERVREMVQNIE
jgi:uncharacterized protein (TIGR00255 family)